MQNYETELKNEDGSVALVTDLFETAMRQPLINDKGEPVGLRFDELVAREALIEAACDFEKDEEIDITSEQWAKVKRYVKAAMWPSSPVCAQTMVKLNEELEKV